MIRYTRLNQIDNSLNKWLYAFIFIHILAWTLAPICLRYTLPMDAMEGTTWGKQLDWGYDKNPFMNAWLTALALVIDQGKGWAIYLFSQLSVGICFWAVWRLAKKIIPPIHALIAVLILEGSQYYSFHAIDFNDNTLELSLWALTLLFFYQGVTENKCKDWLLTGICAGLGVMTKYYTVMLLIPMGLFMLLEPQARICFRSRFIYLGLLLFSLILLPHVIWLFSHDFVTVDYVFNRIDSNASWFNHIKFPLQFGRQQIQVFLPPIILLSLILFPYSKMQLSRSHFNNRFLLFVAFGPFLLTLLLSALFGMRLRAGWGQPLISLWGVALLTWLTPEITYKQLYRLMGIVYFLLVLLVTSYCIALYQSKEISSANFPGKKIASVLTQQWQNQYHKPLTYVTGPRWLAGNISFYSKDHPAVYIDAKTQFSPWIDEIKLKQEGALFVWDPTEECQISYDALKARFPQLGKQQVMHFSWLRNPSLKPLEIQIAFLPPEKKISL